MPSPGTPPTPTPRDRQWNLLVVLLSSPALPLLVIPGGEPLYEWIDVREVMSGAPSEE